MAGVTQVDATGLKVQWWARHPMRRTVTNGRRSDEQITRAIQSALQYDPRTKRFPIEVAVSDRIVTLSGQVPNLDAKRAATSDAEHTTGVQRVLNHLEVVQVSQPPDPDIQRRVTRALLEDPFLKETRIGVHVEAGTVHLSGTVHSLFDKVRAETIAARATGVLAVRNNLSTLSPRTDKRDAVIRKDIQERIRWNPYLYGKNISVGVEDGIATLVGSVYSLAESQMATQKAYEGGALHVRNRLSIAETQFSKSIE